GLVGAFFGRLIMAAVSRQREYLADASAVQFTRNTDGIGGALKKIRGPGQGGGHRQPPAPPAGHQLFAYPLPRDGPPRLPGPPPPRRAPPRAAAPRVRGPCPGGARGGCPGGNRRAPPPRPRPAVRRDAEVTGSAAGAGAGLGVRRPSGVPGRPRRSGSN